MDRRRFVLGTLAGAGLAAVGSAAGRADSCCGRADGALVARVFGHSSYLHGARELRAGDLPGWDVGDDRRRSEGWIWS